MSTGNRRLGQQNSAQRVQRALNNPNEPVACKKCGSIFFMEVNAQIYTSGQYGFRAVSTMPQKVYVCLCGELIIPPGLGTGIVAGGERDLYAQSIGAAVQVRQEQSPDALAKGVAGIHELRELKLQVEALKQQLTALGIEPADAGEVPADEEEVIAPNPLPPVDAAGDPPVTASGNRGRSQAGATEALGDVKFVEPMHRPAVEGGARARMKRQGR